MSGTEFSELMALKFMRAMAAPGEAVGVLAAQSIGGWPGWLQYACDVKT